MYDYNEFITHLAWFCGEGPTALNLVNPTFREAYERTGRLINITCTPFKTSVKGSPPLILNHLTAPDVTLSSAVCASSCVPMLIEPVALMEKSSDGSLRPYVAHDPM
jgi:predicted acylesterase/phospholipase RssA